MARTRAPMLSFGARGQIGKTMVSSSWRGVSYMREYVVPSNPQTGNQMSVRNVFSWLNALWKVAPTAFRDPWTAAATGQKYTDRNKLISSNAAALGSEFGIEDLIVSPGSLGGPALNGLDATAGSSSGEIDATATAPNPPTGWTLDGVRFFAIHDQDPHFAFTAPISYEQDNGAPYDVTFTDLIAADAYYVAAYPVWTRPDGRTAYGPSLSTVASSAA